MQLGRWNHQSLGGSQGSHTHTKDTTTHVDSANHGARGDRTRSHSRPYSPHNSDEHRSRGRSLRTDHGGYARDSYRVGQGGGRRDRGGIGAFGKTESEIAKFMNKAVAESEETAFVPEHAFADFPVHAQVKKNIVAKGYTLTTPIQDKTIPPALLGRDIVGLAETGTGKTAAFLIPLIDKVMTHQGERVLIMAPTRELAIQIEKELAGLAKGTGLRGVVAVGGTNIRPQIIAIKHEPSFVIGTPGRLKDLMERRVLDLSGFGTVVLDEADRMLDMGFIDDMRFILAKMRTERQTLFFSATMSKDIERLIGDFFADPVIISVKTRDTACGVDQNVVRIPRGKEKLDVLAELLGDRDFSKVLVFGRTKHGVERLAKDLSHRHIHADSIHGDKTFSARMRALDAFKAGKIAVLVATDVAARGLDIPAVSHVINYDLPSTYEDYIHRIGRTGRATAKGKALTFVSER